MGKIPAVFLYTKKSLEEGNAMYQVSEALDKVISGSGRTFYARLNGISDGIQEIVQTNFQLLIAIFMWVELQLPK